MTRDDRGSAVVEFVLVSVLVVALVLALLQLAFALHVRNTLVSAAGEGARFAAAENRSPADGAAHTVRLVRATLPGNFARDVSAGYESVDGVSTVAVEVVADLPVFGWLGPAGSLRVRGHSMVEGP